MFAPFYPRQLPIFPQIIGSRRHATASRNTMISSALLERRLARQMGMRLQHCPASAGLSCANKPRRDRRLCRMVGTCCPRVMAEPKRTKRTPPEPTASSRADEGAGAGSRAGRSGRRPTSRWPGLGSLNVWRRGTNVGGRRLKRRDNDCAQILSRQPMLPARRTDPGYRGPLLLPPTPRR
jgi:hypothetical protein